MSAKPPGPGSFRTLALLISKKGDLTALMESISSRYGDVARARLGPSTFYLVTHPAYVEDVLVLSDSKFQRVDSERRVSGRLVGDGLFQSEGEEHLARRRLLESFMYTGEAERLGGGVVETAIEMRDRIEAGKPMDLFEFTESLATAVMVRLLFGRTPSDPVGRSLGEAITQTIAALDSLPAGPTRLPERLPFTRRKFTAALKRLDALVHEVIQQRRGTTANDITSMLIRASETSGARLSDEQIRNELLTLFRGHQAVSTALTWTFHALAGLQDIERRLHDEIDTLAGSPPSPQDVTRLDFTRRVFQESLRLYPPAYVLARKAVEHHVVAGFEIPAGAQVLVSEWVTHRDQRFWPDPLRFDPDRFLDEAASTRPTFAFYPQGGGTKMCMGKHFVVPLEGPLLVATLAQAWKFTPVAGHRVRLSPKATLKPKNAVLMVPERRGTGR
ncbi:MAG: cytochrome P450 [Actinomycetota bacterium]